LRTILKQFGNGTGSQSGATILASDGICPICVIDSQAAHNGLSDLFEAIEQEDQEFRQAYLSSDGICLEHLRQGIRSFGDQHPKAADFILENTVSRLERESADMQEYIRKHNWKYREEKMTKEESEAWRKMLTFFTGLPGNRFDHVVEEF
jgi:hypothetical protein